MNKLENPPIKTPVLDKNDLPTWQWQKWFTSLREYINSLEARVKTLEGGNP
jgi:hypothetical protein